MASMGQTTLLIKRNIQCKGVRRPLGQSSARLIAAEQLSQRASVVARQASQAVCRLARFKIRMTWVADQVAIRVAESIK
jgi:hypothetical protein